MEKILKELQESIEGTKITSEAHAYATLRRIANFSPSYKEKVGCAIVGYESNYIYAVGFNYSKDFTAMEVCSTCGAPVTGVEDCICRNDYPLVTRDNVVHAEAMAVARFKDLTTELKLAAYVTKVPCKECAKLLSSIGVIKIVILTGGRNVGADYTEENS